MYINDAKLYPLQYVLINIEKSMDFFTQNAAFIGYEAYELQQRLPQDGMRMALVVVIVLPIACAYPFFQKYFVSGLTIGAVKG